MHHPQDPDLRFIRHPSASRSNIASSRRSFSDANAPEDSPQIVTGILPVDRLGEGVA